MANVKLLQQGSSQNEKVSSQWEKPYEHIMFKPRKLQSTYYWQKTIENKMVSHKLNQLNYYRFINALPAIQTHLCKNTYWQDESFIQHMKQGLMAGTITVQEVDSISTLYFQNTDSFCQSLDVVWFRLPLIDLQVAVYSMWCIRNLPSSFCRKMLKPSCLDEEGPILIIVGHPMGQENMEILSCEHGHETVFKESTEVVAVEAKYMVQQLYCCHKHIKAPLAAMKEVENLLGDDWPNAEQQWWDVEYNQELLKNLKPNTLPYCGIGVICAAHKMHLCEQCAHFPKIDIHFKIIAYCCELERPSYHLYSIYQGYLVRYFNNTSINGLNHSPSDQLLR